MISSILPAVGRDFPAEAKLLALPFLMPSSAVSLIQKVRLDVAFLADFPLKIKTFKNKKKNWKPAQV